MATYTGTAAANHIIGTAGADTIRGMGGNDILEGRGGNDVISGGGGADRLIGGLGADTLDGGAGRDAFVYTSASESPQGAADVILNWSYEDTIDLSGIDANSLVAGNQSFHFAGYVSEWDFLWHGAGNLYIGHSDDGQLWVLGFTDSDWKPDLFISISAPLGAASLTPGNLIL